MDLQPRVKQWIDDGKDPRSARWQAAIESVLDLFLPNMPKGRLTPVAPLEDPDHALFESALKHLDLSPNIYAAFLPPRMANAILPPQGLKELIRIDGEKPSYKIIVMRPGKESRILCAEISEQAHRPGVDIFQEGAFIANYDYDATEPCTPELFKAIRAHGWEKENWQKQDHMAYTVNWFERALFLNTTDVAVDQSRSVFHSPTLIKADNIDALFLMVYEVLRLRFSADHQIVQKTATTEARQAMAENGMLALLNAVRTLELVDFAAFTNAQNHQFQNEFARTLRRLSSDLDKLAA